MFCHPVDRNGKPRRPLYEWSKYISYGTEIRPAALKRMPVRIFAVPWRGAENRGQAASGLAAEYAAAGVEKDLRTGDDIGVARVFLPMMTDATDRRHEQHASRQDRR